MTKRSKRYREAAAKVDRDEMYSPVAAFDLLKSLPAIAAVIASAKASDLHKNARKETRENGGYLGPW